MKDYNDKYMKEMGVKSPKLMKSHGNVSSIDSNAQKYDMKRMQFLGRELKGYDNKAYEYKY